MKNMPLARAQQESQTAGLRACWVGHHGGPENGLRSPVSWLVLDWQPRVLCYTGRAVGGAEAGLPATRPSGSLMRVCYLERWTAPTVASGVPSGLAELSGELHRRPGDIGPDPLPSSAPALRPGCLAGQLLS